MQRNAPLPTGARGNRLRIGRRILEPRTRCRNGAIARKPRTPIFKADLEGLPRKCPVMTGAVEIQISLGARAVIEYQCFDEAVVAAQLYILHMTDDPLHASSLRILAQVGGRADSHRSDTHMNRVSAPSAVRPREVRTARVSRAGSQWRIPRCSRHPLIRAASTNSDGTAQLRAGLQTSQRYGNSDLRSGPNP